MTLFEWAVRPALFRIGGGDAENAHEWMLRRLERLPAPVRRALHARYAVRAPRTVFGIDFPNPVGLAAGMDKDGRALGAWPALGFGFVEVGTVTPAGQPGNERPRLFRLRAHDAVVNRMGFNNAGAAALAARMCPVGVPVGVSLGKAKATALDQAVDDYVEAYKLLRDHGDYFAVNVSSPNTPGLCTLQDRGHLDELLSALVGDKPVLVKIAPDLTDAAVADALAVCLDRGAAGVIATNTTLGRAGLPEGVPAGGLSGRPLTARARAVVDFVHRETGGKLPIVGVGGIMTGDDGARMFDAGADLVQLYTGFIYHGPALVRAVAKAAR